MVAVHLMQIQEVQVILLPLVHLKEIQEEHLAQVQVVQVLAVAVALQLRVEQDLLHLVDQVVMEQQIQ